MAIVKSSRRETLRARGGVMFGIYHDKSTTDCNPPNHFKCVICAKIMRPPLPLSASLSLSAKATRSDFSTPTAKKLFAPRLTGMEKRPVGGFEVLLNAAIV